MITRFRPHQTASQTRITLLIYGGADAATSINVAVFNAGIGLGALIGGLIIHNMAPHIIPAVSAGFVVIGLIVIIATGGRKVR